MPTDDLNANTGEETANAGGAGTEGTEGAPPADAKGAAVVSPEAGKAGEKGADGKDATGGKGGVKTVATENEGDEAAKAAAAAEADAATKAATRAEEIKAFREGLAKHASAGDKKAFDKEMKRLERLGIERPEQLYGHYRELDNKLNGGGLVKVPGKDAKPEEIAEFNKALGVPEKPDGYLDGLTLENGAVIGEADKPVITGFTAAMHKDGAPPSAVKAALNWYYSHQAQIEADQADADDEAKRTTTTTFKEELGGSFRREMTALKSLFADAPGGGDDKNPDSLYSRMLTARTQDGKLLGNDPDFLKQLMAWRRDIQPFATVTEDGAGSAKTAEARLEEIKGLMLSEKQADKQKYWSDAIQAEERTLMESLQRDKARAHA